MAISGMAAADGVVPTNVHVHVERGGGSFGRPACILLQINNKMIDNKMTMLKTVMSRIFYLYTYFFCKNLVNKLMLLLTRGTLMI